MRRQYIFDKIRDVFRTFGFGPLETPAMENLSTCWQIRRRRRQTAFQNPQFGGITAAGLNDEELRTASRIAKRIALRPDGAFCPLCGAAPERNRLPVQTLPDTTGLAGDRPQKGRYREFYQCDVDVIGTRSLLCEVELIQIVERVFRTLGINVSLKVNNRKILYGIAETIGHADKMIDITVAIDKLEKIGLEAVKAELTERASAPMRSKSCNRYSN